jgi:large subunit ribosomal protein L27
MLKSPFIYQQIRHATKKSGGSSNNGRTSQPKYLGLKKMHNAQVEPGNIIVKQRGTQWHPGAFVGMGKDHSIYALVKGKVVLHYDLETQKRIISVDDGSLPPLPSKTAMKAKIAEEIDSVKYLKLDGKGRYDYVMETIASIAKREREAQKQLLKDRLLVQGSLRKFTLVDLTLV